MTHQKFRIEEISARQTFPVRHPVLREGRPIEDCEFLGDEDAETIHLGLFLKEELIGVASYFKVENDSFTEENQYQLRGMAILITYQGNGYGNLLLAEGERKMNIKNTEVVWCNARKIAVDFYKRNGFAIMGEPFEISGIGKHYVMFKQL